MDANTRDVLVTLIQVGGGAVGALIVAVLGFRSARGLERERWRRDEAKRQHELQLKAFGRFIAALDAAVGEAIILPNSPNHVRAQAHLNATMAEVRLVAPLEVDAGEVYDLANAMTNAIAANANQAERDLAQERYLLELAHFQVRASRALQPKPGTVRPWWRRLGLPRRDDDART